MREVFGTRFTLFVFVKQARETTGRVLVGALSHTYTYGQQLAVACLNDLNDGRMAWCSAYSGDRGDLTDGSRLTDVLNEVFEGTQWDPRVSRSLARNVVEESPPPHVDEP